ncbi:MAG: hypothetical protein ACI85K_003075 [Hyphomicrobiaceae bacterium]|jgi:hypothetical protein
MSQTPGIKNVTPAEVELIQSLYRGGLKMAEIVEVTERSMSVIERAVRGMKRKQPTRYCGDNSKLDDRILRLVEKGLTRAAVGERVGRIVATPPHVAMVAAIAEAQAGDRGQAIPIGAVDRGAHRD